jgi:hypothetical protein
MPQSQRGARRYAHRVGAVQRLIPLLSDRHPVIQAGLVVGGPVIFGTICGFLLDVSSATYLIASVLSVAGGFLAGFEHAGWRGGALRGVVGGTLFGSFILIGHAIDGGHATVKLPDPHVLLVALTAFVGTILGSLGGRTRGRVEASP